MFSCYNPTLFQHIVQHPTLFLLLIVVPVANIFIVNVSLNVNVNYPRRVVQLYENGGGKKMDGHFKLKL